MAKKVDPKAKQKRQKVIAAVGGVLLLGILAIQVPKTMKMLNAQPPPTPVPTATTELTSGTPIESSALPTPGAVGTAATAAGGAAPSGDGALSDSDPSPVPANGQLIAFGTFASKDPFTQQVEPGTAGAVGANGAGGGAGAGTDGSTGGGTTGGGAGGSTGGAVTGSGSTGGAGIPDGSNPGSGAGAATTAVIAVNGVEESVTKGNEFPKDAPVFRLVSLTRAEAKISIAGGALASGARAVSLKRGKTLTLVNTADGTRYELKLVSTG